MTPPRLIAHVFGDSPLYRRMATVLRFTAGRYCPAWDRQILDIDRRPLPKAYVHASRSLIENTQKMVLWAEAVERAGDGDRLVLLDSDSMITRPLDDIWDRDFDFAYTTKPGRFPFNSGVALLRVSSQTRAFVRAWLEENLRMLGDAQRHAPYRHKYGGINQAALGCVLEGEAVAGLEILELPCVEWNCEDTSWAAFDPTVTRIVHVKSHLRLAIFDGEFVTPALRPLVALWHDTEQAAHQAAHA